VKNRNEYNYYLNLGHDSVHIFWYDEIFLKVITKLKMVDHWTNS